MALVLDLLDRNSPCPKCGAPTSKIRSRYCPGCNDQFALPGCTLVQEHLHRQCRCGYIWLEYAADTPPTGFAADKAAIDAIKQRHFHKKMDEVAKTLNIM